MRLGYGTERRNRAGTGAPQGRGGARAASGRPLIHTTGTHSIDAAGVLEML